MIALGILGAVIVLLIMLSIWNNARWFYVIMALFAFCYWYLTQDGREFASGKDRFEAMLSLFGLVVVGYAVLHFIVTDLLKTSPKEGE